jgi:hypothetical protein
VKVGAVVRAKRLEIEGTVELELDALAASFKQTLHGI